MKRSTILSACVDKGVWVNQSKKYKN